MEGKRENIFPMKREPRSDEVKIADGLDLSRVDKDDRGEVRNLVANILQFEEPMPKVTIDVFATHDHYNISIKNWSQSLCIVKLYKTFMSTERDSEYESILGVSVEPVNDENIPVLKFKVRKSGYTKIKRRH